MPPKSWTIFAFPTDIAEEDGLPNDGPARYYYDALRNRGLQVDVWKYPESPDISYYAIEPEDRDRCLQIILDLERDREISPGFAARHSEFLFQHRDSQRVAADQRKLTAKAADQDQSVRHGPVRYGDRSVEWIVANWIPCLVALILMVLACWLGVVVSGINVAPPELDAQGKSKNPYENSGQLGDSFGSVNALFTGLGLAASAINMAFLIYSIRAQTAQIEEQRQQNKTDNDREKSRDWYEQDKALRDLNMQFRGAEFHEVRRRAWTMACLMMPELNVPEKFWDPAYRKYKSQYRAASKSIVAFMVPWYAGWQSVAKEHAISDLDALLSKVHSDPEFGKDYDAIEAFELELISRKFAQCINLLATFASITSNTPLDREPHQDYLGYAWTYWGAVILPFHERMKLWREEKPQKSQGPYPSDFWELHLPNYIESRLRKQTSTAAGFANAPVGSVTGFNPDS